MQIADDEVHVWRARLDELPDFLSALAPKEQSRANRFYRQQDRDRFARARGVLRNILARYTRIAPAELRFRYNSYGKPCLVGGDGPPACLLRFNLSHSHGLALYAIALGREVGVDVEYIRQEADLMKIAERFFSPREVTALRAMPPDLQIPGFFRCWTRKEAYLKGKGQGLFAPLKEQDDASAWHVWDVDAGDGYVGAVALQARDCRIVMWDFSLLP